jgi:hypothetical protein
MLAYFKLLAIIVIFPCLYIQASRDHTTWVRGNKHYADPNERITEQFTRKELVEFLGTKPPLWEVSIKFQF